MRDLKDFLSTKEQESLILQHHQEKNRRTADRIKAILLSNKGWKYRRIAIALLLDEQTISRHVSQYISTKKVTISSGGSSSKLSKIQAAELEAHLEENTYVKVSDICSYVQNHYEIKYTVSGITAWLYQYGFSYKKPKPVPAKADPVKQEAFIKKYNRLLKTTPQDEPILFGDGVHPTMATKITYGWIKKGKDKTIATIASRTRINLMGAINLNSMDVNIEKYETLNSESIIEFLDLLKTKYPKAPKIHLILDRGSYNTSDLTSKAAKKRNIILHHLPSYSPNLNPIERLWKVMNEYTRNNKVFESAKEFRRDIMGFFHETWPSISESMRSRINDNFQRIKSTVPV